MNIPIVQAQHLYTTKLIATLTDRVAPQGALTSLFKPTQSWTRDVSVQTSRVAELIATDQVRGAPGHSNVFGKSSEKLTTPAFYDEYLDVTQLDGYDQLYADPSSLIADIVFGR